MQALISTLMLLVTLGFEGQPQPPTYGQVIEVMAAEAAQLGDSRLTALVSDLCVQCLERGEWAHTEGQDTLRKLSGRLRNRGRAVTRTRRQATERKRAQRLRKKRARGDAATTRPPAPHEVLHQQPDAPCDATERMLEARDTLDQLGFQALGPRARSVLVATEVMGLRHRATAELLGLGSEDQVRQIRTRALSRLRAEAEARA